MKTWYIIKDAQTDGHMRLNMQMLNKFTNIQFVMVWAEDLGVFVSGSAVPQHFLCNAQYVLARASVVLHS